MSQSAQKGKGAPSQKSSSHRNRNVLVNLTAGALSGAVSKTLTAPLERTKIVTQMAGFANQSKYRGAFRTMVTLAKEGGVMSLWQGNWSNVVRVLPNYALKFALDDKLREQLRNNPLWGNREAGTTLRYSEKLAAGTMVGMLQCLATLPLETVRTRLTMGDTLGMKYKGMLDCFSSIARTEGFSGFFKGLSPTVLTGAPYVGIQFSLFNHLMEVDMLNAVAVPTARSFAKMTGGKSSDEPIFSPLPSAVQAGVAGAVSGVVAQVMMYPGDTVKRRMQANGAAGEKKLYTSTLDCCSKMLRKEGIRSFYNGCWVNTVKAIPSSMIQFAAFGIIRDMMHNAN